MTRRQGLLAFAVLALALVTGAALCVLSVKEILDAGRLAHFHVRRHEVEDRLHLELLARGALARVIAAVEDDMRTKGEEPEAESVHEDTHFEMLHRQTFLGPLDGPTVFEATAVREAEGRYRLRAEILSGNGTGIFRPAPSLTAEAVAEITSERALLGPVTLSSGSP